MNAGDLVANVGRLDRLRVRCSWTRPELGRVAVGQPVTITWQALPGRKWEGSVERMPTSIEALGSRQVGEVVCTIENPGRELIPGTNVDAEIRTAVVDNALVIPRETLRHDAQGDYVMVLKDGAVERRAVKIGASTISLVQVTDGLSMAIGSAALRYTAAARHARHAGVVRSKIPVAPAILSPGFRWRTLPLSCGGAAFPNNNNFMPTNGSSVTPAGAPKYVWYRGY